MVGCALAFKLFDEPLVGFGRRAGGKANRLKTERSGFIETRTANSFYLFNPGKMMLVPDSSQSGKAGNCRFDETLLLLCVIEKDVKE